MKLPLTQSILMVILAIVPAQLLAGTQESESRLNDMKERIKEISFSGKHSKDVSFKPEPLFRYSDPTRNVLDATIWRLGEKGRPKGIAVLEYYTRNGGFWSYEITSTSTQVPRNIKGPQWTWDFRDRAFKWTKFQTNMKPSGSKRIRGSQMKQLVRKLRTTETWGGQTYQLRLLPKAIVRYEDPENNVVDGHIFVFAHGTNAELLVLIEAQKEGDDDAVWKAGFARLGAAQFSVEFDKKPFWNDGRQYRSNQYMNNSVPDDTYVKQ